jgi:hypothetical protein
MRRPRILLVLPLLLLGALASAPPALAGKAHAHERRCQAWTGALEFFEWQADHAHRGLLWQLLESWRERQARRFARLVADRCVHLNEIQVLGTHNSYHVEGAEDLLALLIAFDPELEALRYDHPPLGEQFEEQGIRQIELDVFADPDGGLYAQRRGLLILGQDPTGPPELEEPGTKVLHVQDVDFATTCLSFVACLVDVKTWSDAHPGHLPIAILVEAKDDVIPDPLGLGFTVPLPFDTAAFRDLDAEIRSVFSDDRILLPDDVRGHKTSLEQAVQRRGWPALGELRGRVLFLLDNEGRRDDYRDGALALDGRVLFTNSTPGEPDAAFVKVNDPLADPTLIPDLVSRGYLVRTRADADTVEARTGDTTRRDAALASGAQFVSTDYPVPDPRFTDYAVSLPGGGTARCNPVNAPSGCRAEALERLR